MKIKHTIWLAGIFLIVNSCSPKLESWFLGAEDVEKFPESFEATTTSTRGLGNRGPCMDPLNYAPDTNYLDHTPIKYVRVNFHWVNSQDSSKNFVGQEAKKFTRGLLKAANYDLRKNNKMWLPHNNDTPKLPSQYRYVLTPRPDDPKDDGIYFHFDDSLCYYVHKGRNRNLFDREVYTKYGVQLDTVLNIFVMPHHPDSVASPTYLAAGVGVALGPVVKVAGFYENKGSFWNYRGVFNHEVGHIYGLSHTWRYNDGCDDTPKHAQNCWNRSARPECDSMTSNNVMDYNAMQHAWTPCQIGKVQLRMAQENNKARNYLVPNWCQLDTAKHIFIKDSIAWDCMKDLEGPLTIEPGGSLTMRCRVSVPKDGKITVMPGGQLILDNCRLHNACGDQWQGIEIQQQGNLKGEVIYIGSPSIEDAVHGMGD